jgi:hypothetical protein
MATLDRRTHKTPYLDMKLRDKSGVEVRAARLRDPAPRAPPPGKPPRRWPPARAVTERTLTTWPVVEVGVMGVPADTRLCRAPPPHQSKHSLHLYLSLLSRGRDPGQLSWPPTSRDPRGDSDNYPRWGASVRPSRATEHENTAIFRPMSIQEKPESSPIRPRRHDGLIWSGANPAVLGITAVRVTWQRRLPRPGGERPMLPRSWKAG